jgi:hypothetical protein
MKDSMPQYEQGELSGRFERARVKHAVRVLGMCAAALSLTACYEQMDPEEKRAYTTHMYIVEDLAMERGSEKWQPSDKTYTYYEGVELLAVPMADKLDNVVSHVEPGRKLIVEQGVTWTDPESGDKYVGFIDPQLEKNPKERLQESDMRWVAHSQLLERQEVEGRRYVEVQLPEMTPDAPVGTAQLID